jgi:hypothetical protein
VLEEEFGRDRIFFDIDTIPPGEDFRRHIRRCMDRSAVCIALVGKCWIRRSLLTDWFGRKREPDHVAIEIELALAARVTIIPVLVGGARMPPPGFLPSKIAEFTYVNAKEFRHDEPTGSELRYLVAVVNEMLGQ